jgi:hypothetical protein
MTFIQGTLVRNDIRYTPQGQAITTMTITVKPRRSAPEDALVSMEVILRGELAENAALSDLPNGSKVIAVGTIESYRGAIVLRATDFAASCLEGPVVPPVIHRADALAVSGVGA